MDVTDKTSAEYDIQVMFISTIKNKMNQDPSHMLEYISRTLMHLHSKANDFEPPTLTDFNKAKGKTTFCQQAFKRIGHFGTGFYSTKTAQH